MNSHALRSAVDPDWLPWLGAALLVVVVAAIAEGVVLSLRGARRYDWRAFAATLVDVLGRRAVDALGLSLAAPLLLWVQAHRLTTIPLDNATAIALLFVGVEFCYYWHHRASHRVRWFWATHCVHHSPNQLTLAAALRLGWTGQLSGAALFFAPLVWLGFAPLAVLAAVALNLLYQFWLHATWMPRLGPLEWVLNTPSHHRVHHASNPAYLDCNYGGVLIVFDRLFGSFVAERADLPPRYGLTTPLRSYNPLTIELHEWGALARDLVAARGWRARWRTLAGPPGRATPALASPTLRPRTSP
jgi:sterol desaturase/sphingolipid hydroxylase (fatty acid hydroxylase superfamily)